MPTATVNGVDLAYVERGQGEPVLFVHGGSGDYRVWEQQQDAFGADHRAIALSCRGSWPNAKLRPDETLTLDTFVGDLAEFIRTLDAGPVNLVGHSSPGGFAGLFLALRHPSLLRTLVLLEPPAFPVLGVNIPPSPGQILKLFLHSPRVAVSFVRFGARGIAPAMKAFARGDDEQAIRLFVTANVGADAVAMMPREQFQRFVENAGPIKAQLRAGFPAFSPQDAQAIRVPTLLVSGTKSPPHLTAVVDRLQALIPDAERLDIAGASHAMFATHPAEFNGGVLRCLRQHDSDHVD
jgi:pimeloyl-ACP methyl ester carboxylesterase